MKLFKDKGVVSEEEVLALAQSLCEAEPAYAVGKRLIASLMDATGMDEAQAAAMLLDGGGMPDGLSALSARAANDLMRLQSEGKAEDVEGCLADEAFAKLLLEMPAAAALRLYNAEARLTETAKKERELGAKDVLEKIAARRALPAAIRANSPAATEADYAGMSSAQFKAVKERLVQAAMNGRSARL